jgi:hypothetical protein
MKKTNIILSTIAILSLILFSACSRTDELPFKVGDTIMVDGKGFLLMEHVQVLEIKGKWFRAKNPKEDFTGRWYNSDTVESFSIQK